MKKVPIIRKITESTGLFAEAIPGISLAELCGDDRLLIENHKCIVAYSDRCIEVRMNYGVLSITGVKMDLACIQDQQLIIRGEIDVIRIIRG